ncbi:MAG TPA: cupin domain-containing protein [Solirubrobacteraceae bacterium]|nr:cupin domain-containing protein [Solirubrobacteraceae bacterium]
MSNEVRETVQGDGWAVGSLDGIGDGYGFRKIRRELGVTAYGINAIVMPAGISTGSHWHERQEETYFVHRGTIEIEFGDGSRHRLGPGGMAHVMPSTPRKIHNVGDEDAVYVIVGGADGYVGRDGVAAEGESRVDGPPGAPVGS